jgi:hypothetical protein
LHHDIVTSDTISWDFAVASHKGRGRIMKTLFAVLALVGSFATVSYAQDCLIPAGVNPYYTPPPPGCVSGGFNPYTLPPSNTPLQIHDGAAMFLFAGGVLNADTLSYIDLTNVSDDMQRVELRLQLPGKIFIRRLVMAPNRPMSIDLRADPALTDLTCSFALQVIFERLGAATLTLRPALSPWSSAITPTPRIVELSPVVQH